MKKLRECGATSPETAKTLSEAGVINPNGFKLITERLVKPGKLKRPEKTNTISAQQLPVYRSHLSNEAAQCHHRAVFYFEEIIDIIAVLGPAETESFHRCTGRKPPPQPEKKTAPGC